MNPPTQASPVAQPAGDQGAGTQSGAQGQLASGDQGRLADAVAAAALAVPGVVDLHTGAFGEVATYLVGRRVPGVQIRPQGCAVHLVLAWGAPVLATADLVRAAVEPLVGTPVDISVEDVLAPAVPSSQVRRERTA